MEILHIGSNQDKAVTFYRRLKCGKLLTASFQCKNHKCKIFVKFAALGSGLCSLTIHSLTFTDFKYSVIAARKYRKLLQ